MPVADMGNGRDIAPKIEKSMPLIATSLSIVRKEIPKALVGGASKA